MDAMKDALMKRRMRMAEMDPQDESLAESELGLMGSEEMPLDDQEEGTDLAPALEQAGADQEMAAQAFEAQPVQGDPGLADLEKMYEGGRDLNNKGFMGKAAKLMQSKLASYKK